MPGQRALSVFLPVDPGRLRHHRNQAIARLLYAYGHIKANPDQATNIYTEQCSVSVNARDLATMAATLASGGIVAVSPGKFGIAVISPPLDAAGNSVRAQKANADISNALGGKPYAVLPRKKQATPHATRRLAPWRRDRLGARHGRHQGNLPGEHKIGDRIDLVLDLVEPGQRDCGQHLPELADVALADVQDLLLVLEGIREQLPGCVFTEVVVARGIVGDDLHAQITGGFQLCHVPVIDGPEGLLLSH
ncbi:MAG: hypothetical protein EXR82_03520 [Gammaproteobacteria bacterium]|nr:hypothetical protein [Gammaproteobacteria bacterium]